VSSAFFLAPSMKSRLGPAGFLRAGHVSFGEILALSFIAQFRRKAILSHCCLGQQRGLCVSIPPPNARSAAVSDGEAATGDPSGCSWEAMFKNLVPALAFLFHDV